MDKKQFEEMRAEWIRAYETCVDAQAKILSSTGLIPKGDTFVEMQKMDRILDFMKLAHFGETH